MHCILLAVVMKFLVSPISLILISMLTGMIDCIVTGGSSSCDASGHLLRNTMEYFPSCSKLMWLMHEGLILLPWKLSCIYLDNSYSFDFHLGFIRFHSTLDCISVQWILFTKFILNAGKRCNHKVVGLLAHYIPFPVNASLCVIQSFQYICIASSTPQQHLTFDLRELLLSS